MNVEEGHDKEGAPAWLAQEQAQRTNSSRDRFVEMPRTASSGFQRAQPTCSAESQQDAKSAFQHVPPNTSTRKKMDIISLLTDDLDPL